MQLIRPFILFCLLTICAPSTAFCDPLVFGTPEQLSMNALHVLEAAYAKLGLDITVKPLPARRSLREADIGIIDGELHRVEAAGDSYQNLIRVEVPVDYFDVYAYTTNSDISIKTADDIHKFRISKVNGLLFSEALAKGMENTTSVANWDMAFSLLHRNRIDVVLAPKNIGDIQREKSALPFNVQKLPQLRQQLYHFLNARHDELVPDITKVLQHMHQSGEMDEILESQK